MNQQRNFTPSVLGTSLLFFALALGGACAKNENKGGVSSESVMQAEESRADEGAHGGMAAIEGRKIVYTGMLSLTVKSYDQARAEVDRLLKTSGGFVTRGESQGSGDHRYATLTLRVPTSHFATLSSQLKKLGEVESETIAADDVTEQHVDLSARLSNARTLEARLLELVAGKTDSVADLLVVEAELGRVREQVERLDAQLRNMNDQVSMATLTLSIYTATGEVAARGLGDRMSGALTKSYRALADSGAALMIALSALLPWAMIFGFIGLVVVRFRSAAENRKLASARQQ
jgi:hypothetical protein